MIRLLMRLVFVVARFVPLLTSFIILQCRLFTLADSLGITAATTFIMLGTVRSSLDAGFLLT